MSRDSGFLLESIPMKIGAGMTFLEVALKIKSGGSKALRFGHWGLGLKRLIGPSKKNVDDSFSGFAVPEPKQCGEGISPYEELRNL